ncbi:hypothetical protein ACHAWU_005543 [Discostella pseudostelligera]|uniref:Uncharacterized protein n=1 Tax=Discostella pseudostelligera TaxID=259834 RepID=A0ABD3N0E4_9STRA
MTTSTAATLFLISILLRGLPSASSSEILSVVDLDPSSPSQHATNIITLMCTSETCTNADENTPGCQQYITPLNACYNAQTLFPNDESWSDLDIYDTMIMMNLKREFYQSRDGTCAGREKEDGSTADMNGNDSFILPLDVCVGPFGPPRPWGKFTLVDDFDGRKEASDVISSM